MSEILEVPIELARLKPETEVRVMSVGEAITLIGGLIQEGPAELALMRREYFEKGRANGRLVSRKTSKHPFAVDFDAASVWEPDEDVMDNIDARILQEGGYGTVAWASSETDGGTGARFNRGKGWEGIGLTWREAVNSVLFASPLYDDAETLHNLRKEEAKLYSEPLFTEYRQLLRGKVYGVVVYAVQPRRSRRMEEHDFEVWGYIGKAWARTALVEAMNETAESVSARKE